MSQRLGPIAGGVLALGALTLGGCATNNPGDPLEPYNRAMFNVNQHVDRAVMKPAAVAYKNVTPTPLRHGISNVFGNFDDMWSTANDLAQGHVAEAANGLLRVEVNTVFGLFRCFGAVFEIDENYMVRCGDRESAVEAVQ